MTKHRSGVYTLMLALTLVAMTAGSALLYCDYAEYGSATPPGADVSVPALPR
jgi:hypothetical protein